MLRTKIIGRQPTDHGAYDQSTSYGKKFQVQLYGCVWESLHDNNNTAPATLNTQAGTITPNTVDWKKVTGSTDQWLMDNGYKPVSASNVKDGNQNQHEINAAVAGEIGTNSTPESIKGRITNLEEAVGSGGSVDERIAEEGARHYLKNETYTKEEVNGMITTPNQEYVSVEATNSTTSVTDVLPATGEADTIYRVGNWDGTQYDASCYTEYAWSSEDTSYIKLSTKQVGIDDTPTAGSDNLVKSGGVFPSAHEVIDVSHIATSAAGTAFKEYYFDVAVGDVIKVTTNRAADWGVYVRISQDGGSTWVKSYDALWVAQTVELEITHNGQLWVTIAAENITNVTTSIILENLYNKFDSINASTLEYTDNHGLGADTIQEGIDELAKRTDCIGHNIFKTTDDSWAVGSADQKVLKVDSSKRYRVRVLSTNPVSYYVGRYNQSWSGTNYDLYTDNNWHEIPMLSDTSWLVLTSTIVTSNVTIEVEEIGVEIYDNKLILPKHTYKVRKSGGRDFTSLLEACIEACKYPDSEVFVEEGTYDLIQEFESYYGSDFFTNYTSNSVVGIRLYNRVHLVFATNAVVTFNYEGNNEYVHTIFSPFNSRYDAGGGFKIDNLHIRAKNCRYCIHDEKDSTNDSYHHAYINCDMYMDNSNNPDWSSKQCIGGGLGKDGYIEVIGCSFETVTDNIDESVFSWHNCGSSATAKSRLNIRDNYVKKGTFSLLWIGTTTAITKAYVSGNSFTAQPKHQSGGGSVENTELISWNNEIRS